MQFVELVFPVVLGPSTKHHNTSWRRFFYMLVHHMDTQIPMQGSLDRSQNYTRVHCQRCIRLSLVRSIYTPLLYRCASAKFQLLAAQFTIGHQDDLLYLYRHRMEDLGLQFHR